MHKKDLIQKIAKRTSLDETSSKEILNVILSEISLSLKKGKRVTLTGFGTFVIRKRKKRSANNIHTGTAFTIPAHKIVGFVVGRPLKLLVK